MNTRRNTTATTTINAADHMALVQHIVNRVARGFPSFIDRDDLVQAGMVGLVEAAQRYTPDHDASFASFASRRIEGAILDHVRADSWMPRQLRSMEKQLSAVEERLVHDGDADDGIVAEEMAINVSQLRALRRDIARARTTSLDIAVDENSSPMSETIVSDDDGPDAAADNNELMGFVNAGLSLLPERERYVVIRYYVDEVGLVEIADEMGIGVSRVSKIKQTAIGRLHDGITRQYSERVEPRTRHQRTQHEFALSMAAVARSH